MIKPEHAKLGMEVISLQDMILSDDTIIPSGTLGVMERICKVDDGRTGRTHYYVHFHGFKNPNSPWIGIGVGLSEIEEHIDGA